MLGLKWRGRALWNDESFPIEIEVSHELFCVLLMDLVGKSAGYRTNIQGVPDAALFDNKDQNCYRRGSFFSLPTCTCIIKQGKNSKTNNPDAGQGQLLIAMLISFLKMNMRHSVWGFTFSNNLVRNTFVKKKMHTVYFRCYHLLDFIRITFIPPVGYCPNQTIGRCD